MLNIDGKNVDSLLFGVKVKALYNNAFSLVQGGFEFFAFECGPEAGDRLLFFFLFIISMM